MLQVLTGSRKGRKLKVPAVKGVRPTTSRVKQSIFDSLGDLSGLRVLDIFAGSGGLGIESLSRDASHVTFIEKDPAVFKVLCGNITLCEFLSQATLMCSDYARALKGLESSGEEFDLIFIDPPYALYASLTVEDFILAASSVLKPGGLMVIEHNHKLEETPPGFEIFTKPFGGTQVSYFRRSADV